MLTTTTTTTAASPSKDTTLLEDFTVPDHLRAILSDVQQAFAGSMIAGGCLRDLDNDRPYKDIDVFAPDCNSFDDLYWRATHGLPEGHVVGRIYASYEDWGTNEVVGVLDILSTHGAYQLIGLTTGPERILPRLDFGICQIGFDGQFIERTKEYRLDRFFHTFTLVRSDDERQKKRSHKRYLRLTSEKYIGWASYSFLN